VAIRLAHHYAEENQPERSMEVLRSALGRNSDDRSAHLEMAKHLMVNERGRVDLINQHLAHSYATNDHNHDARHLHAQYLFSIGRAQEARSLFAAIDASAPQEFRRRAPANDSIVSARLHRYTGTIATLKATMAFIRCAAYPNDVFAHSNDTRRELWRSLRAGDGVSFKVRFNRAGPVALELEHQ
jgi:cold shock CspA family protein